MAKGLPKVANYVKNAGKSLAFAAIDSVSENIEGIKDFADANNDVFKEVYAGARNYRQTMKKAHKAITESKTFVAVRTGLKNMKDDLKSGQLYHNRDYSDEIMGMDDMESDFGFTISSDDGEGSSSGPSETVASAKMLSNSFDQAIGAAADAQCKTIVSGVEVVTRSHEASTKALIATQERSTAMISSSIGAVYGEVSNITKFLNTAMVTHMNNSSRFYEEQIKASQELVAMQKELLEMQRNLYAQKQQSKDTTFEDAFTATGGMNIKGYAKAIKKNVQTHVFDALGLSMLGGGGMNPLMMWAQNPWQPILSGMMGMFLPKNFKGALKGFDKSLSSAFSTFIAQANAAGKNDDGSILSFLGKIFGIDLKEKKKIDTANYKKDAVSFDGITRQSIIETIPGYLARIEAALTGSGERYYDFQTGSWKSAKQVKAEHENRRNMNATSAGLDLQYALQPYIEEMAKLNKQSADDFRQQISAMNRQVFEDGGAFSPKKNDSYYYGMSKSNMDYLLKLGRNDPKVRAAIQGLAGNHMRARQNQNRYMEDEERNGGISRILYNHTYEGNVGPGTYGGNRAAGYGLLSLSKDADGHNVFWYLKEILKTLGNKIPAGSGRRTKAQRRKERRSRGSSSSSSSSGSSSDDGGDGESDAEEIFGDADASLWTEEELLERATKAREEEEAKKNPTKKFGDRVREKFGNTKAGQFLGAMADKFGTVISAPMEYMTKLLNKADQNLFKVFFGNEKMVDKDGNEIDSVFNYMISRVKDAFEGLSKWFKDKFDPFKDKVKEKLKPLWDKYGAPVKNAMGDMFRSGKNRVKLGFNRTIGRGMDAVGTAFNERTISAKEHEFAKKAAEIGFDEAQVYEMAKEQGITATTKFLYQQAEGSPEARKAIVALGKQYRTDISRVNTKIKARKARRDQIISELEKGGVKSAEEIKKETEGTPAGEQPATSARGRIVTKRGLTMISPGEIIIPASTDPRELARMESLERTDRAKIMNYIGLNAKGTFNTEEMKSNLYKIWEENKDPSKASRVGAGGILGAGAGLLMGNPLLGALAGAGISVLQNSETLKTMLFGEKDDEGNRKGGVIPKSVVDIFKKHGKDMGDFGIAGGLLGLLTPFGVLGGAAIGAGIGYLKNNDNFKKFVFGDAETGKDGLISKETAEKAKKFFKKSVPAMGVGAIAGILMGPFGLLGNAVLGAGAGLLTSTSAFHKFVFGDPDNPKKGSLVGAIKNGILNPAKERIKKIFDDLTEWGKKKILDPLKNFGKELGIAIKNAVTNTFDKVKDFLNNMFEKTIGIPIHDFLQEKIFKPITKTFFNILKAPLAIGKAIIGAPFKAMGAAADHMQKKRVRTGRAGEMTAAERLQFRKDKKMGKDKFTEQDEAISQMDESQLKGIEELVKGRLKAREAAGKNLGGVRQQMGQEISSFFNEYDEGGHQLYDRVGYNKVKKIAQIAAEGDEEGAFEAIDDLKNLTPEEKNRLKKQIKGLLDKTYKENADFRKAKDELAAGDAELEKKLGRRIKGNSDLRQIQRAMADEQKARLKRAKKDGESGHEPEPPTDPAEATNLFKNIYEERTKTIIEKIAESNELLKAILNPKAAAEEAKSTPPGNSADKNKSNTTDIVPTETKKETAEAAKDKKKQEDEEKAEEAGVDDVDPEKYANMSVKDKLKQKTQSMLKKANTAVGSAMTKVSRNVMNNSGIDYDSRIMELASKDGYTFVREIPENKLKEYESQIISTLSPEDAKKFKLASMASKGLNTGLDMQGMARPASNPKMSFIDKMKNKIMGSNPALAEFAKNFKVNEESPADNKNKNELPVSSSNVAGLLPAPGSNLPVPADPAVNAVEAVHGEDSVEAVEAKQKAEEEDAQGDKDSANHEETKNTLIDIKNNLFGNPKEKGKKKGGILSKIGDAMGGVFSFLGGTKVGKAIGIGAGILGGITLFGMFGDVLTDKVINPIKKLLFGNEGDTTDGLVGKIWTKASGWFKEKFPDGFGGIVRDGVQYIADNFQKVCDNVIQPIIEVLLNNAPVFIAGLVKALVSAIKNIKWGQKSVGDRTATNEYDEAAAGIAGALGRKQRTNTVEMAQATDEKGNPLYYTDETQTETTTNPTDYPVMEVVSGYTVMNTNDSIGSKMASAGGKAFVRSAVGIGKSGVGKVMSKVSTKGVGKGVVKVATKGVGYTVKGAGASVNLGQKAGDIVHDVIESTAIRQEAAKELAKASGGNADDIYKAIMKKGGDAKAIEDVAIEIAEKSGGNLTDDILEIGIKNSDNLANSAAFKSMQKTAAGATKNIMGNAADDIAEGGLKGLGKAAKNVAKNSADNIGSKIAAGLSKAFAKIGDSKIGAKILSFCGKGVSTTMLKEALEKIAQKLSKNIVGKVAGKALGKIASGIAGKIPFVAIAIWVKDFLHGFDNADTILGVAKGDTEFEVNFGHKIVCGLLELITNQFTFGLLPSEIIVDVCVEFLFPLLGLDPKGLKEARARAQEIMDEWNEAHPEEQYDNLEDFNNKDKLHVQIGKALKNTQIGEQVQNVKQVGGGAIQMFKDAGSTIKNIFSGIKNGNLDETMAPLIESFKGLPKWIIAAFKNLWTSAVTGEDSEESQIADDDPLKGIKNVIQGVMKVITCPITSIVKFFAHFKENMAKMWDSLKKFGSFIWQGVKNVFIKAWDGNMLGAFSVKANQENERGLVGNLANVVFSVMKIAISPIIYITSMVGKVKNFVMDAIECGKVIIPILGTMVGQLFKKSWEGEDYEINISTTGNDMIDNVMKGVFGIVKVVTFVPRAITWAVGRIVDTVKIVIDAGKQMIPKLATAVGGLFVAAWKGEDGPDAPESTGNNVMDIINKAIFFVVKVVTFVPRALTWVVGRVVDTVKVVINAGKQMLPKLGTAVGALFTAAWKGEESPKSPESTGNNVMDIINNVIFQVVKVLSTPLRIIVGAIGTVVSFITGGIDGLKQRLKPVTDAFDWIKEKIMGIWDGITGFFENTFGKIKSFFGGGNWGFPDVGGWISDKFGAVVDGIKNVASSIGEGISNAWSTVKGWFSGAGKHIYQSDPTVANRTYGPTTIGENGCAPVAATNAINNVRGKTITLNEAARHAENNGFLNKEGMTDMKYFESIFNKYGIKTQATNDSNLIMEALKHGHQVVMLGMDPQGNSNSPYGSRPHFITGVGLDNKNNIVVEDPDMPQSRVSYDPRRVLGTTLSAMVTSEKIDGQVGSGRGANALTESRRAAAAHYGSARALDSYEPAETPVVVHAKDDKSGGAGGVSYEVFLETIVNVLMQIAANTGLLAKILELLSEKLDINLNKEEVQKVVEQNTAGTKAALARIIQRSGDANAAKLIGDKDTDYLLKVMSGLASE